jgi:uncharacterized protein YaeQ
MNLPVDTSRALAKLAQRDMELHCTLQDGQIWIGDRDETVQIVLATLKSAQPPLR